MTEKTVDVIATEILLDAKQAILSLKGFNNSLDTSAKKTEFIKRLIGETAKKMGGDIKGATAAVSKFSSALNVNPQVIKKIGYEGESAFRRVFSSINTARIALGAFTSMLLFQGIQAVTTFFREASDQARQLEENIWRLENAERALSKAGTEISLKGMEDAITRIQKKFKVFSREDITQLYSSIAVATKQLGLSEKEISDLTESVVFLNIQSSKQEDLMTTQASLLSSLLGKSSTGVSQLGVSFKEQFLQQEAARMGLLKHGEALSKLTDEQLGHVKVSLLVKAGYVDTAEGIEIVNDFLDTNSAKIGSNKSAWADLSATIGQFINNIIPNLVPALETLQKSFEVGGINKLFSENANKWSIQTQVIVAKLGVGAKLTEKEYAKLKETLSSLSDEDILKIFPDPSAIKDRFTRELVQSIVEVKDTVTENSPILDEENLVDEDTEKALADIEEKIQDIILEAKQAQEELDLKLEQKQQDLDTEYARKQEDAARDHSQKLVDIDLDARRKAEDAKAKLREDEKKAEQDLLQKLKELRQRFLLDLEDALHARDARQVLRLIKEYKLEKQNILDKKKLDDQQRKESLAEDLRQIELERQRRIQNENIEYQRRLDDLAKAKAREQEELQLWYQREQEDIQRNVQQKLEKLLAGYIAEGKIHESEQARIYGILAKYFAKDMALVDSMAQFMATRFAEVASMAAMAPIAGNPNYQLGPGNKVNPFLGNYADPLASKKSPYWQSEKMAEGGTLIANRPTTAIFGEKGPEAATFTPLNRTGRDVNKVFGDVSGGGINGQIMVAVDLSPDLEGRIINRSLDGVAEVVGKVNRRKV